MRRLFLASHFIKVARLFPEFVEEPCAGKTVTFIPTASKVEKVTFYVGADRRALKHIGLEVMDLDISVATQQEISDALHQNDYVFVGGGNSFYLLQELKRTGTDTLLVDMISSGKPYIGSSAGSIVLSPDIGYIQTMDDPGSAPLLDGFAGLGVTGFHVLPHATDFPFKKAAKAAMEQYGDKVDLKPISNNQAVTVRGDAVAIVKV